MRKNELYARFDEALKRAERAYQEAASYFADLAKYKPSIKEFAKQEAGESIDRSKQRFH